MHRGSNKLFIVSFTVWILSSFSQSSPLVSGFCPLSSVSHPVLCHKEGLSSPCCEFPLAPVVFCSFPPSVLCFILPGFPHLNLFFPFLPVFLPISDLVSIPTQDCVHSVNCISFFPHCSSFFSQILLLPLFSTLLFMWIAYVFILVGSNRDITENKFRCQWSILIVRKTGRPIKR